MLDYKGTLHAVVELLEDSDHEDLFSRDEILDLIRNQLTVPASLTTSEMVAEFHRALGQQFGDGSSGLETRKMLHGQEHEELMDALATGSRADAARELGDVVYVAEGTAFSMGIPLFEVVAEIHAANMRKINCPGGPTIENGKVMKPPHWMPPDVAGVLQYYVNESC